MPLRKRPAPDAEQRRIDAVIDHGGSAPRPRAPAAKLSLLQLRLARPVIDRIDRLRAERTVAPSRHAWIVEALLEKLARDGVRPEGTAARPRSRRRGV